MSEMFRKLRPSGTTIALLVILGFFGLSLWLVYRSTQPQDLSQIAGYSELKGGTEVKGESTTSPPRDLLKVLSQADYLGESVELTESELNRYLHMTLSPKQNGVFNLITRIDGVWVKLHEGFIELIIERRVQGYQAIFPHQFSYFIRCEQTDDGKISLDYDGGDLYGGLASKGAQVGTLNLPQSTVGLFGGALQSVAAVYEKELEFLTEKSSHLEINEDRVLYVGRGTGKPR